MEERDRLFLDASIFVAAAGSPEGGSAAVLALCQRGIAIAVTTRLVLEEAEVNIREKMGREALLRFYDLLGRAPLEIADPPSREEVDRFSEVIAGKDAHILASALGSKSNFVLTLDRKHFLTPRVRKAVHPLAVMMPGEYLRQVK